MWDGSLIKLPKIAAELLIAVLVVNVAPVVVFQIIVLLDKFCCSVPHVLLTYLRHAEETTETHISWYLYFKQVAHRHSNLLIFKVILPFSDCSTLQWSRQAISPQRPDNYGECSNTSKSPGHKSLRAQYASLHTSLLVCSLLFCLQQVHNLLECVSLTPRWARGEIKLQNGPEDVSVVLQDICLLCAAGICFPAATLLWMLTPTSSDAALPVDICIWIKWLHLRSDEN